MDRLCSDTAAKAVLAAVDCIAPWPPLLVSARMKQSGDGLFWENHRADRFFVREDGNRLALEEVDDLGVVVGNGGRSWTRVCADVHFDGNLEILEAELIAALTCEDATRFDSLLGPGWRESLGSQGAATPTVRRVGMPPTGRNTAGAEALDALVEITRDYLVLPEDWAYDVLPLWGAHTWAIDQLETTPRLDFSSPQFGCGKTVALEFVGALSQAPTMVVNASIAAVFRAIDASDGAMTLLLDERDTLLHSSNGDNEQLKSIFNGGYRRGATVMRSGDKSKGFQPQTFTVFCPAAMAGIGELPPTLRSRSIVIPLRRRLPTEPVREWSQREARERSAAPVEQMRNWLDGLDHLPRVELPATVTDRAGELWRPLIRVAQAAGGDWPERARAAAVAAVAAVAASRGPMNDDNTLLAAIRSAFEEAAADRLFSDQLINYIKALDSYDTAGITPALLAEKLRPYGVHPRGMRIGDENRRGYYRSDLEDTWRRYL